MRRAVLDPRRQLGDYVLVSRDHAVYLLQEWSAMAEELNELRAEGKAKG